MKRSFLLALRWWYIEGVIKQFPEWHHLNNTYHLMQGPEILHDNIYLKNKQSLLM